MSSYGDAKARLRKRAIPLFGGLIDCDGRDHWNSLGQTIVIFVLSTVPIWLGTLIAYATGSEVGYSGFRDAFLATVKSGQLFMYCTALLAPIFWIALVDPPGARVFPSKVSHMVLIVIIDVIAAVFFGLSVAGNRINESFSFRLSVWMFFGSLLLLYLGTVYHTSRLPDAPQEFRKREEEFTQEYREHRPE